MSEKKKILFILKNREKHYEHEHHKHHHEDHDPDDRGNYSGDLCSGLSNSVKFIHHMIETHLGSDYHSDVVEAIDGNCIDRLITHSRPSIVIIEAIWVTPEKLMELIELHPRVSWVIRLHSEVPFLASDGIAMDWLNKYIEHPRVKIAANSLRMVNDLGKTLHHSVMYLPNCYEFNS